MQAKIKKLQAVITGLIIILLICVTILVLSTIDNKSHEANIEANKIEILKRDSVIGVYRNRNDSIDILVLKYKNKVDSLQKVKKVILDIPTKQTSKNVEEAYNEMIKELNKYKLETNENDK